MAQGAPAAGRSTVLLTAPGLVSLHGLVPLHGVPLLHAVTDTRILLRPDFARQATELLERGGPGFALHLRGSGFPARRLMQLLGVLGPVAEGAGALLVVNDRVDVALAMGARAVQLGSASLDPGTARGLVPEGTLIGVSVHSLDEVARAEGASADFLLFGSVFPTLSHPDRTPAGPKALGDAVRGTHLPVIAIGGIDRTRVGPVRDRGAAGLAVIRAIWDAEHPAAAAAELVAAWGRSG